MEKISNKIFKYPKLIIVFFLLITLFFAAQIPKAQIDPEVKNMLEQQDFPSRLHTAKIEELFGGTEILMIMLETDNILKKTTLTRIKKLNSSLKRMKGIEKVYSLFEAKNIKGEDGMMLVEPLLTSSLIASQQYAQLKQEIINNDLVYKNIVAEDFSATAIIGVLRKNVSDQEIYNSINELIKKTPGPEKVYVSGLPYTRTLISTDIRGDMKRLVPLGLLIMLIFLLLSFRQARGVILPFMVVIMAIIVAFGSLVLLGWKIQMITIFLPIMLIAIANDYGIHLIAKYQELNTPERSVSSRQLAKEVFTSLGKPVLITGLTTVGGMLCLLGHEILPARQLGILAALGVSFALFASLFLMSALMSLLPKSKPIFYASNVPEKKHRQILILSKIGSFVAKYPKAITASATLLSILALLGLNNLVVDTNPINYYPPEAPIAKVTQIANQHFGGSTPLGVVIKADIKDPSIMKKIESIEEKIAKISGVGNTSSIAKVVKQMSRALHDPKEELYNKIPNSREAISQYFELYYMGGDPGDFEKLVDFPYEHALINVRINSLNTSKISQVVEHIKELKKDYAEIQYVGGFGSILAELAEVVVKGQLTSLLLSLLMVFLLISLLFKSIVAGLISIIPLFLSLSFLFGLMGYFGIELNVATALLSSIMIGVGVDYTIHFLWRYRKEKQMGLSEAAAVIRTLETTGRGITLNALSVIIGFTVLFVSDFLPVKFFGFLIVVSVASCLIGALILIPAVCLICKPKFLDA